MQYLLHIDTSSDTGIIAISGDGVLLVQQQNNDTRNHAAVINILINDALNQAGISLNDLSAIVVCAGPGSYTGLRIGLATAKAFCYVWNIPLILDNKLTLLAHQAYAMNKGGNDVYIAALKARDKEYFMAIYNTGFSPILLPMHIKQEDINELIEKQWHINLVTDTADIFSNLALSHIRVYTDFTIDLKHWAEYAFEAYKCNRIVNLSEAEPFYLKQVYTHK